MTSPNAPLKVSPTIQSHLLSPEQKRFNKLTQQIEQAREKLSAWHASLPPFLSAHRERTSPLLDELDRVQAVWVGELDRMIAEKGWSKHERVGLRELLCETVWALLERQDDPDPDLQALHDKHSDVSFADAQAESRQEFVDMIQGVTGVDLGDDALGDSHEELMKRLHEKMAEQHGADDTTAVFGSTPRAQAKLNKAEAKRRAQAELTSQSLRDIYRKLVSALHPDREPDPEKRAVRTALMQRANQAYEKKDLLGLLTLQLETAQIDANDIATTAPARLKLYNKALAEQLADIQSEVQQLEHGFRMDFGVAPFVPLHPAKLIKVIDTHVQQLRHSQAAYERDIVTFKDKALTKRWLKREMERLELDAMMDGFPF